MQILDPITPGDDELLTPCGVSHHFHITSDELIKMRRRGEGPDYVRMPGNRQVRYSAGKVRLWIRANTVKPVEAA